MEQFENNPNLLTQLPFFFLKRSINICIVDDDPKVLETYSKILNSYPLYALTAFSGASDANTELSSNKRFHVCIMDLGLDEIDNDEFYLVKKYSPRTSFIVLTGRDSIHKGFQCGKYGSFSVFEKPVDFGKIEFMNVINEAFIQSLVNTGKSGQHKPINAKILEALLCNNPTDISDWAFNACVTEQYLRRVWSTIYGYQPKYFLWFYKTMISAFSYHNAEFLKKNGVRATQSVRHTNSSEKEILAAEKYFISNKSIFDIILKY